MAEGRDDHPFNEPVTENEDWDEIAKLMINLGEEILEDEDFAETMQSLCPTAAEIAEAMLSTTHPSITSGSENVNVGPSSSATSVQSSTASSSSTVEVDPSASSIHSTGATATATATANTSSKKRSVDDPAVVKILEKWYAKNVRPFPSKYQMAALIKKTKLDPNQIERWLREKNRSTARSKRTNRALLHRGGLEGNVGPSSSEASVQSSTASTSSTVQVDPSTSSMDSIGATAAPTPANTRPEFPPDVVAILEDWYAKHQSLYPSRYHRLALMNKTGLNKAQLEKWFSNKRSTREEPETKSSYGMFLRNSSRQE